MRIRKAGVLALITVLTFAFSILAAGKIDPEYVKGIEEWRKKRSENLKKEDGWLSLVGLFWLKEGENKIGSATSNTIIFPKGKSPDIAGTMVVNKGSVKIQAATGAEITHEGKPVDSMTLVSDAEGNPTVLQLGSLNFHVIKRGERLGVRVKDKESPQRLKFSGVPAYPIDPAWRIEAQFQPYKPHKQIPIANIVGITENQPSPGAILFQIDGKTYKLDPILEEGEQNLFVMFADKTSGIETYGAGRYLYTKVEEDGKVILDFNKAYNPPCVFTNYATCPLPPPQNKLPIRVAAGEKNYKP